MEGREVKSFWCAGVDRGLGVCEQSRSGIQPEEVHVLERISFESPKGVRMAGVVHWPEQKGRAGVVICHGMLSHKDTPKFLAIAEGLEALGYAVLRFDFVGRGESEGTLEDLDFSREAGECRAALGQLRARGIEHLGLLGSSMGGAVAIMVASEAPIEAPIEALVTLAAIGRADLLPERAIGERALRAWERRGMLRLEQQPVGYSFIRECRTLDLPARAARVRCPWLILHGEKDKVIPPSDAMDLQKATGGRALLEILADADHQFSLEEHRRTVARRAVTFLDQQLRQHLAS